MGGIKPLEIFYNFRKQKGDLVFQILNNITRQMQSFYFNNTMQQTLLIYPGKM